MNDDHKKPQFQIARVPQDSSGAPQIFPVDASGPIGVARRKFLGTAVPAAMALAAFWSERVAAEDALIKAHRDAVSFLAIPPDASVLFSAASDGYKTWTLPDGTLDKPFALSGPFESKELQLQLAPSGNLLMAVSALGVWLFYSFPKAGPVGYLSSGGSRWQFPVAALSPDEKNLAIADGDQIFLASKMGYDYKVQKTISARCGRITQLFIRDSSLISGSRDGRICAWRLPEGTPEKPFETGSPIKAMQISEKPFAAATGHDDGNILVASVPDGKSIFRLKATSEVRALELGPGGSPLISGAVDGSIDTWSLETGERLGGRRIEFSEGLGAVTMFASSAKGSVLAVGSSTGKIVLLDWPSLNIRTHLFDRSISPGNARGLSFTVIDKSTGRTVTYTLPCGSQIPPGAICVCNCVPGTGDGPSYVRPATDPPYSPPSRVPGETITQPCTPAPVPPDYVCTCNCIPGR
jgi:WD40 repeat protein